MTKKRISAQAASKPTGDAIFDVFKSGRKRYVKVKPGKHQLVFASVAIPPVIRAMHDAFELFAGKCIQNNHSETTNNTLRTVVCLGG